MAGELPGPQAAWVCREKVNNAHGGQRFMASPSRVVTAVAHRIKLLHLLAASCLSSSHYCDVFASHIGQQIPSPTGKSFARHPECP
ncbi:hypothetical protein KC337_g95 [Hortaea werneckii]|nr:hypothetical protein KC337_g95 [Hortaea werneckii]